VLGAPAAVFLGIAATVCQQYQQQSYAQYYFKAFHMYVNGRYKGLLLRQIALGWLLF
jgi:hypothetical protein